MGQFAYMSDDLGTLLFRMYYKNIDIGTLRHNLTMKYIQTIPYLHNGIIVYSTSPSKRKIKN